MGCTVISPLVAFAFHPIVAHPKAKSTPKNTAPGTAAPRQRSTSDREATEPPPKKKKLQRSWHKVVLTDPVSGSLLFQCLKALCLLDHKWCRNVERSIYSSSFKPTSCISFYLKSRKLGSHNIHSRMLE